jgi:hypothetical protein
MMQAFGTEAFIATLAILGVVIVVSALLSGVIERSGFPQVAVFLALGALLGPWGLRLWRAGDPVVILDVRSERTWRDDDRKGRGALRVPPDTAVRRAGEVGLSNQAWPVAYCA